MVGPSWWHSACVYQVYLRSFCDSNGDGTGDIAGLRSRLPYLEALGVDALWVNPWYPSPLRDGGYDVADYCDIHPQFGDLAQADALLAEAAARGIRVILDLVPNHTSSEHAWFRQALDSPPGSSARGRYHFHPGRGPGGSLPPSNWQSVFGGPTWTRVPDGQWYLHLFDPSQPDLNWSHPDVRREFLRILRFWLDRGAAGFRIDVAHGLAKDMNYPDLPGAGKHLEFAPPDGSHPYWARHELHDIVREWRAIIDSYGDRMLVAEAWVHPVQLTRYLEPDQYHQAFAFRLLRAPWDAAAMSEAIAESLAATAEVHADPTWVLSNHDTIRHTTRYGLPQQLDQKRFLLGGERLAVDYQLGLRRARAAALMVMALPGSLYLYQGEELGLPEVVDLPEDVLDDPVWRRSGGREKGRDGCRVPLPWSADQPHCGFGGPPWLPQPADWARYAASTQDGVAGSTLELYRAALALRRTHLATSDDFAWLDVGPHGIGFRRGRILCLVNLGSRPIDLPDGRLLLASGDVTGQLPADTAAWLEVDRL